MKKIIFIWGGTEKYKDQKIDEDNQKVVLALQKDYLVDVYDNLWQTSYAVKKNYKPDDLYALVTNLPPSSGISRAFVGMGLTSGVKDLSKEKQREAYEIYVRAIYEPSLDHIEGWHECFPNTKIIAYTGADEFAKKLCLEKGVSHVVSKGMSFFCSTLDEEINQILEALR